MLLTGQVSKFIAPEQFGDPDLFYSRFLLNGLTEKEEQQLSGQLQLVLRSGEFLAFEHRTSEDDSLPKARFRSFCRHIKNENFIEKLEAIGVQVLHREEGLRMAELERKDPHVVRIIAKLAD